MRRVRAVWRLVRALAHGLHGLAVVLVLFPFLHRGARRERVRWWSAKMLRRLGLALEVRGDLHIGPKLLVANHVSWLDILVVHAICPEARFVSKAEVKRWPLVGRLVAAAETLYLERDRKRDALRVLHQMGAALTAGDTVAVFPESTTGPGDRLLPFHANLLQAAIATGTPVQPLALRFSDHRDALSPSALWIGETTMAGTLWLLASAEGLVARLQVMPPRTSRDTDRRALAHLLRADIKAGLAALDERFGSRGP